MFEGWYENGQAVSTNTTYTFRVYSNRAFEAHFSLRTYANHWTPVGGLDYHMGVNGVISIDGVVHNRRTLEIGAFCGDECRGSRLAMEFPPTGEFVVPLNVSSPTASGDTIVFKLYDHISQLEYPILCNNSIVFEENALLGMPGDWYPFDFDGMNVMITLSSYPEECGTVTGAGEYGFGSSVTVTAMPNEGYVFLYWSENGVLVSLDAEYTFYSTASRNLVAHFVSTDNIVFADNNVKALCVAHWDTNGDGELSYAEAVVVTDLGQVFRGNTTITSFEELQYFISLTRISAYEFMGCGNLTGSLYIPNSVTYIGDYAFYGCSGLSGELIIPNYVTSIGDDSFRNCSGLTSVIISNSVTSIGECAFMGCSGLAIVTIGNSVNYIGHSAFCRCSSIKELKLPSTVAEINDGAFSGCTGLEKIVLPKFMMSIFQYS